MDPDDIDFVSDLNEGTADDTVPASKGSIDSNSGSDIPATKVDKQDAPKAEKPTSLRDQISSALKGEEGTPPAAQQDGQPRTPDGKFAAKGEESTPSDPNAQPSAGTVASSPVAVPAGIDPTVFNSLPAETQAGLARTMEELNERSTRLAGYEHMEQLIAPRRQAWALNGMTEAQAVSQLFALSDFAGTDPEGFVRYFAQQSGLDLEDIVFGTEPVDPETAALKHELATLKGQIEGFNQQQQATVHQSTVDEVVSFFSEQGQDGKPLRPYAEEVGADLLPYISVVMQQNPSMPRRQVLQEAYDRACWSTPTVRARMQEAANAAAEAERLRAAQAKANNARHASSSVQSGVPTSPPPSPADGTMSLRDTIRASFNAAS